MPGSFSLNFATTEASVLPARVVAGRRIASTTAIDANAFRMRSSPRDRESGGIQDRDVGVVQPAGSRRRPVSSSILIMLQGKPRILIIYGSVGEAFT